MKKRTRVQGLLDRFKTLRASFGGSLNDDELTRLVRDMVPAECGFSFLGYSTGFVLLGVPHAKSDGWPNERENEQIARDIAQKHGLHLCELGEISPSLNPDGATQVCQRFELSDGRRTVIVAHPQYLKLRLFVNSPHQRYSWEPLCPLTFSPDLLQDLSLLYCSRTKPVRPQ